MNILDRKSLEEDLLYNVEKIVKTYKMEYLDAVVAYCDKRDIEIEQIASIVKSNQVLMSKIQNEAEDLNFLPKRAKLPIHDSL